MNLNLPKTISHPPTIAIIGGGFSGSMIAAHLLRAQVPVCIKLIERRPEVGAGIAYSTSIPDHLLNVPASRMSAFPDQPDHFLQWLQHQWLPRQDPLQAPIIPDRTGATFVPRMIYGDYIRSILSDAIFEASDLVRFERVTGEAIAIEPVGNGALIRLSHKESLYADQVVLAIGNFPASLPLSIEQLNPEDIREAWSRDAVTGLNADDPVLLVGTGLTMVDMVLALRQQNHQGPIYAVSRHGLLPQSHQSTVCCPTFLDPETAPRTTRELLRLIRQKIAVFQNWHSVIDALRPITSKLWQNLSLAEQRRFLRHVKPYWDTHRHRIAPEIGSSLAELIRTKQLVYYAGRIQSCRRSEHGIDVTLRQRGTGETFSLMVKRLINCTGSNCNYRQIQHPLIVSLQKQQLIRPSALGLGIDTSEAGAVINANSQPSSWLYTLGPTRQGTLWETTAIPELRIQAQELAETLLTGLLLQTQANLSKLI